MEGWLVGWLVGKLSIILVRPFFGGTILNLKKAFFFLVEDEVIINVQAFVLTYNKCSFTRCLSNN
jgi:hypothetical protein